MWVTRELFAIWKPNFRSLRLSTDHKLEIVFSFSKLEFSFDNMAVLLGNYPHNIVAANLWQPLVAVISYATFALAFGRLQLFLFFHFFIFPK